MSVVIYTPSPLRRGAGGEVKTFASETSPHPLSLSPRERELLKKLINALSLSLGVIFIQPHFADADV